MSAGIAELARIGIRVEDALPAHLEGQRQPTVDDDPQVAIDVGLEPAARVVDLDDAGHDVFHLTVLGLIVDAEQDRIGAAESHVCSPGGVRVLLVVLHVGKDAVPGFLK